MAKRMGPQLTELLRRRYLPRSVACLTAASSWWRLAARLLMAQTAALVLIHSCSELHYARGKSSDPAASAGAPHPVAPSGAAAAPASAQLPPEPGAPAPAGKGGLQPAAAAAGDTRPAAFTAALGDRIYSKVRYLWIRPEPRSGGDWIGYLSLGDSVPVRGGKAAGAHAGPGHNRACQQWYAVEPRGYVCVGDDATLDPDNRQVVELRQRTADRTSPWPYRYGESLGTTVYLDIPPASRQRFREPFLAEHLARVREAASGLVHPDLVGVDLTPAVDSPPPLLLELGYRARTRTTAIPRGATLAYTAEFRASERSWVMTWDRGLVPKDKVRILPRSQFHGVPLGAGVELPLAFFRTAQPKYQQAASGAVEPLPGAGWQRYGWAALTGAVVEHDGQRFWATRDGQLCAAAAATVVHRASSLPVEISAAAGSSRRKWIDVSIGDGWLVAYEHDKPVYATLISPGRGGSPRPGVPHEQTASTPVGKFHITTKLLTTTPEPGGAGQALRAEIPYTQSFAGPWSLQGAYWHDDWGVGKSGGSVHLSPIDARWLFDFTEPELPPGWHGIKLGLGRARAGRAAEIGSGTLLVLHR